MKKLLIGLLVVGSFSSLAALKTIKYPEINGINFSANSDADVVCNYLGFESSISIKVGNRIANVITVDRGGILGASFGYFTSNEGGSVNTIDKITCEGEFINSSFNLEIPSLIKYPSVQNSRSLISRSSSESGVCRMLGFSRSVGGTLGELVHTRKGHSVVNADGEFKSIDYSTNEVVKKIICI